MLQQAAQVQEKWYGGSSVLDICFGLEYIPIQTLEELKIWCDVCGEEAFIFQEEGNFCLNCWQERTESEI